MEHGDKDGHLANVVTAIDRLEETLDENMARASEMRSRIRSLRSEIDRSNTIAEVVQREAPPLVVELLTDSIRALHTASALFRQSEARALHAEGLTMERIAELFGVTRQRVSALLKQ